jgi:hypothetical protein
MAMDKNPLGDGRQIPLDDEGLRDMLASGPPPPESSVSGEVPPMPIAPPPAPSSPPSKEASSSAGDIPLPTAGEGPDEEMKERMILPSEAEKSVLKAKFGSLRVVPLPYTRGDDKVQTYVLRQLTRSQWRTMEAAARKVAESKPGISAEEIFQEKIVAQAVVWPNLPEHEIAASPPGLVPTLFGIIQQMGLFFNPDIIMSLSFTL